MSAFPQNPHSELKAENRQLSAHVGQLRELVASQELLLKTLQTINDGREAKLTAIRELAEPFRYALQQLVDKDWHDDYTVFVDGALSDENGLSITAKDFYKLLNAIYGEFPKVANHE